MSVAPGSGGGRGVYQVLCKVGYAQRAKASECQPPDGRVLVSAVLKQHVNGEEHQLWVRCRPRGDILVQRLFEDHIL